MPTSQSQIKANKKYHAKFDRIHVRVPLGEKELIEAHANMMNESVNAFIRRAIAQAIQLDNTTDEQG